MIKKYGVLFLLTVTIILLVIFIVNTISLDNRLNKHLDAVTTTVPEFSTEAPVKDDLEGILALIPEVKELSGTITNNTKGTSITIDVEGYRGFKSAVITVTDSTSFGTKNGTFIAVYPDTLTGEITVTFDDIIVKDGIANVTATSIKV